jgi:HlyD family secretion protein
LQTISASGTLQADEVIDVGSQVTGPIASFGNDKAGKTIDYRSEVEEGKVLATIDPSVYKSEVDAAQAALDQANAMVISNTATLAQLKAKLDQAQSDWDRAQKLGPSDALAQSSYDNYKALYEVAKADVGVGEAAIVSAKAGVAAAQASLDKATRNLAYCVIKSPVDGVIIDRRVNIGQTVVSSQSVSSLFLIAKDLKHMQIWASVNEADVGNIHNGQPVTFTVDAFPNRKFKGQVDKLRYNATMTNNVVTYTVEIDVDNADEVLIPYMTANVSFEVARHTDVLLVPNAALRYTPPDAKVSPDALAAAATKPTVEPTTAPTKGHHGGSSKAAVVWIADGDFAKPVRVRRGITDGINTEVQSDELPENTVVIVGDAVDSSAQNVSQNSSIFTPKMPNRTGGNTPRRGG